MQRSLHQRSPPSAIPGRTTRAALLLHPQVQSVAAASAAVPTRRRQQHQRARASAADAGTVASSSSSCPSSAAQDDVRAQLRSLISRLSASAGAPDDPALRAELVALLPSLKAASPTPEPARSPKIDGAWVLVATVPNAARRETRRSPLQRLLAAAYDFFYERVPIIAGSAVGKQGASGVGGGGGGGAAAASEKRTGSGSGGGGGEKKKAKPSAVRARGNFQTFDVPSGVVRNRAAFEAFGRPGEVNVDGSARVLSGERLEATFLTAGLTWGGVLSVPFPIGAFRPTGWIDTVYLDDDVRVSLGDKGSVFVARRARGVGGGEQ